MKAIPCILLIAVACMIGCKQNAPDVGTHVSMITGLRTDLMFDNELINTNQPQELVWLNASRVYERSGGSTYYLEVAYAARAETGLLDVSPGPSLIITTDDKEMTFEGLGSLNTRTAKDGLVRETAIYPVKAEHLREVAKSKAVKVVVIGRTGRIEREFNEANFEKFRKFVQKYT